MNTLRHVARMLERSSVKQIAKDLEAKEPISIRVLLTFEFVDPERLRQNIVLATQAFKGSFPSRGQLWNSGLGLNESQVNSFFTGSSDQKKIVDCFAAALIIMARGLIQTLEAGEFDKLGYTSGTFTMPLSYRAVDRIEQMSIGDWAYIRNDWRYLTKHPHGSAQGENIIKVSDSEYYGFPMGKLTYLEWEQMLIYWYNRTLPEDPHINAIPAHINAIPGFQGDSNMTFDIRAINLNVWKLRKPAST